MTETADQSGDGLDPKDGVEPIGSQNPDQTRGHSLT